jgi:hypothetical protein
VGAEALLASIVSPFHPWIWMLLLTLPVASWLIEYQQLQLRRAVVTFLDELASSLQLHKVRSKQQPVDLPAAHPQNAT